jgi:glutathione S-transferase
MYWRILLVWISTGTLFVSAQTPTARDSRDAGSDNSRLAEKLPPAVSRAIDFVADVQPIFRQHCFECHASGNEEGSLNLGIKSRVMEGGEHGPVLKSGNSASSSIIHWVAGVEDGRIMPPDDKPPLTKEQIGVLRAWIDQGANWPADADVVDPKLERARQHWAYQRLQPTVKPPALENDGWSKNSIDQFIAAKHAERKLAPSPPLPARALARRIYLDLLGLPPTLQQVDEFIAAHNNDSTQAVHDLVDRLLGSQHYGERWARHWLDLVRFAESDGQESDKDRPHAYRYRDFVIRAFNDDVPYDQFVQWQIAGDEIEPNNSEAVAATGFLTAGTQSILEDKFLEEERLFNRYNQMDDVVSTLGTSLLGLTVGCARCHDHKYDAFSARDYYRLMSAFHSGDRTDGKLPDGSPGIFFKDFDANARTTWLFRRSDFYDRELEVRLGFPALLTSGRDAEDYWAEAKSAADAPKHSTLQRRALADWIVDVEHGGGALLARVFVNRVWQHHFGQGLVRTESDFGVRGDAPTHPELLEYLASDFVQHGWQLKRLQRLILGTAAWQQGNGPMDSEELSKASEIDPENRLLWKMAPQRLEVEVLRDTMLAVSGNLNLQAYGPSFKPYIPPEANTARNIKGEAYPADAPDNATTRRRSIYMFHKRLIPYPLFQAFDRPDLMVGCARRQNTTVAPQALAIMNDRFVRACAADVAKRLIGECGEDDVKVVHQLYLWAFSRPPDSIEVDVSTLFIQSQTKARQSRDQANARLEAISDYSQSVFGLNEFIYVD